jgi:hypothetical protein
LIHMTHQVLVTHLTHDSFSALMVIKMSIKLLGS